MRLFQAARLRADALVTACVALALVYGLSGCTSSSHPTATHRAAGSAATSSLTSSSSAPVSTPASGATTAKPRTTNSTPAAKTVPPPVPGNIHQTVPARKVLTRHAVSLRSVAHFNSSVTARLTAVQPIHATAHGPGEIAGPALELSVRIANSGKKSIDLSNVVVNLSDAAGEPGLTIAGKPADPFRGSLAAGHSATGRYVFTVPTNHRAPISVTVSYVATVPVVLFVGNAS